MQRISAGHAAPTPTLPTTDDSHLFRGLEEMNHDYQARNYMAGLLTMPPQTSLLRRFHKNRTSLHLSNTLREEESPEQEQKHDTFGLDDDSVEFGPAEDLSIDVSEMSQEHLFSSKNTPRTNTTEQEGSQQHDFKFAPVVTRHSLPESCSFPEVELENLHLTGTSRRQKVERYLRKKLNRSFKKKISYHCRKAVADSRLRVKGRFVTRSQAQDILGHEVTLLANKQIKVLLQKHYSS